MTEKSSPFLQLNAAPPSPGRRLSRKLTAIIGVILLAIFVAAFCYRYFLTSLLFDAVVDGQRATVSAPAGGQVQEVHVNPGQIVNPGQPLFVIDLSVTPGNNSAVVTSRLKTLEEQIRSAEKTEEEARLMLQQASQAHARALVALRGMRRPAAEDTAGRQTYARMQSEEVAARTGLEAAHNRLETASSARYVVQNAYRQMRETLGVNQNRARGRAQQPLIVMAPMQGRLENMAIAPGMLVGHGQPLAEIMPVLPEHMWISASVDQRNAAKLKQGKAFRLRFPEHPDLELTGELEAVGTPAPDTPAVPVRLRLVDYDPLSMPALVFGETVELKEK